MDKNSEGSKLDYTVQGLQKIHLAKSLLSCVRISDLIENSCKFGHRMTFASRMYGLYNNISNQSCLCPRPHKLGYVSVRDQFASDLRKYGIMSYFPYYIFTLLCQGRPQVCCTYACIVVLNQRIILMNGAVMREDFRELCDSENLADDSQNLSCPLSM